MKFQLFINYNDVNHQILENIDHSNIQLIMKKQDDIQIKEDMTFSANDHKYMIITTLLSFEFKVHSNTDQLKINM